MRPTSWNKILIQWDLSVRDMALQKIRYIYKNALGKRFERNKTNDKKLVYAFPNTLAPDVDPFHEVVQKLGGNHLATANGTISEVYKTRQATQCISQTITAQQHE